MASTRSPKPGTASSDGSAAGGEGGGGVAHGEEQLGGVVDQLLGRHVDAPVEPRRHELGRATHEDGGGDHADALTTTGRPVPLRTGLLDESDERMAGLDAAPVERLVAEGLDVQDAPAPPVDGDEVDDAGEAGPHLRSRVVARRGCRGQDLLPELLDEVVVD